MKDKKKKQKEEGKEIAFIPRKERVRLWGKKEWRENKQRICVRMCVTD